MESIYLTQVSQIGTEGLLRVRARQEGNLGLRKIKMTTYKIIIYHPSTSSSDPAQQGPHIFQRVLLCAETLF